MVPNNLAKNFLSNRPLIGGLLLLLLSPLVSAERQVHHNGFLTAAFSQTDSATSYSGIADDINFSEMSVIGIQTKFQPSAAQMHFTIQLLARGSRGWDVDAEWAYVGFKLADAYEFQIGKIRAPMFLVSETLDVGITYPWIRPPVELYGFANIPFTTVNGMKAKRRFHWMDLDLQLLAYVGENPSQASSLNAFEFNLTDLIIGGVELLILNDKWKIRASYHDAPELSYDATDSIAADPNVGAIFSALAPSGILSFDASFATFGGQYDSEHWLLMGEVGQRKVSASGGSKNTNYFITIGRKLESLLLHVTYSEFDTDSTTIVQNQSTTTIGIKKGLNPTTSIKAELSQVNLQGTGSIGLYDILPGNAVDKDPAHILGIALNMVF
ncbi:MAG TPA: hypothetical protein DCZ03_16300 [Gammaproteobacteria bacterium]|nr:hypothetical protein [Gammaproteobacteria bacterium]